MLLGLGAFDDDVLALGSGRKEQVGRTTIGQLVFFSNVGHGLRKVTGGHIGLGTHEFFHGLFVVGQYRFDLKTSPGKINWIGCRVQVRMGRKRAIF